MTAYRETSRRFHSCPTVSWPILVRRVDPKFRYLRKHDYRRFAEPWSIGWNVELDREIASALAVRAGFLERNSSRDFALNPARSLEHGIRSLLNTGQSFYREFQVIGRHM